MRCAPTTPSLAGCGRRSVGFLMADRAEFGWQPAVDCWLAKWDPDFSARLATAGFVGLTVPTEYGGRGMGYCTDTWSPRSC
jgi:alkylation response protein AidB-like acyl-CoA dehydrogenase